MISVGIDPALAKFHICVTEFDDIVFGMQGLTYETLKKYIVGLEYWMIPMGAASMKKTIHPDDLDFHRYQLIDKLLHNMFLTIGQPDIVAIEEPAYSKTPGKQLERGYVYYHTLWTMLEGDIPFMGVNIKNLKKYILGSYKEKNAKKEMLMKAQKDFPFVKDDDQADSLFLSCYGMSYYGKERQYAYNDETMCNYYIKYARVRKEL